VADNWRPLFQIAHIVGGHWPARITDAFHALTAPPPTAPSGQNPAVKASSSDHSAIRLGAQKHSGGANSKSEIERLLLADIRGIFTNSASTRITSSQLVRSLCALPDSPWPTAHRANKPITERWLAFRLRALGVLPHNIRIGHHRAKGYDLADFSTAFHRFLGNGQGP
jgi:hypothetical protein